MSHPCRRSRAGLALVVVVALGVMACPDGDDVRVVTLVAPRAVTITNGESQPVAFDVPRDAISVTVGVEGPVDAVYGLGRWEQPGDALVPAGWLSNRLHRYPEICASCANRIRLSRGTFAALAPNNPGVSVASGRHTISVVALHAPDRGAPATASVTLSVHAKVGAALPDRGALALDLYLADTRWSAATAPDDLQVARELDRARTIFATAGITLQPIRFHDLPAPIGLIGDGTDATDAIWALTAQTGDDPGVSIVLVDALASRPDGTGPGLRGISLSVPSGARGGVPARVVVATRTGLPLGLTIAHEIGHSLGLFHTSEAYGGESAPQLHDQLPDTADADASLLLYPSRFGARLTPSQSQVLRRHPRVRHP